jgi:molecular chaperone DnaK
VQRTIEPCRNALKDAEMQAGQIDEVVLVGGMTRMPKIQEVVKQFFGKEPHKGVNPDEVVAIGAAIQAGVLQGDVKDVLLLDVTPLSLGVETLGGLMTSLIEKNTTIPTSRKETFSTASDNQTSVTIHVLQGEREFARDNRTLGKFDLTDIPSAPRGTPQIEVEFALDANGILNVSATDKATGKSHNIQITGSSGLDKDEIDRMKNEAESNASDDKSRRELIELKNQGEQIAYQVRKQLEEHGDKVSAESRSTIESSLTNLESKLKEDDKAAIEAALKQLNDNAMELGKAVYEAGADQADAPEAAAAGGEEAGPSGDDDVIDAEYEVKEDE